MQYVCLIYLVEKDMNAMTRNEADACTEESLAYDEALRRGRHLVVAHALEPVETATTIRVRNGKVSATDGPFAETKEAVGGFDIIECGSMEEAVEIAAGHPIAQFGTIEVRPLWGN